MKLNNFDGKSLFPPHLLSLIFCVTPIFLKHRRLPLRKLSAYDRKDSTQNIDTSFFRPLHHLSINFFASGISLKHSAEEFFYEKLRCSETKKYRQKIVIPPPLLSLIIFVTRIFLKHRRVPLRNFRHCVTKEIRRKTLILPSFAPSPNYP